MTGRSISTARSGDVRSLRAARRRARRAGPRQRCDHASCRARSCCARPPRSRTAGRAGWPIPSPPLRAAGCGCAAGRASAASSCRSSSPIIATGRSCSDHRGDRSRGDLGDAWPRGRAGASDRQDGQARPGAGARRLRGRGRLMAFAELLDRLVYTPSRNAKLQLLARLLPRHARSRSRLGAGRADRRPAVLACRCGARCRSFPAHGPGALSAVARLCRRHGRDGLAAVGAAASPAPSSRGEGRVRGGHNAAVGVCRRPSPFPPPLAGRGDRPVLPTSSRSWR